MIRVQAEQDRARARRRPRRSWSLAAAQAAHAAAGEGRALAQTVAELGWLLLVLVLGYAATAHRRLAPEAVVAILAGGFVFAAVLVVLHTLSRNGPRGRWAQAGRFWAMGAFVAWVIGQAPPDRWLLANLFYVVIVASALALGQRLTLLNFGLIAAVLVALARTEPTPQPTGFELVLLLAPMALVAYAASRLSANIRDAMQRIRFISETDELTRMYNLRAFMQIGERLHRQARRYARPYAMVMIDSDNLKAVNDAHGHQTGNELLKRTAGCIRRELRETDVAARYGGDEFILLLPETSAQGALELSERIRTAVAARGITVHGLHVATSVSIGIAAFPEHGRELRTVLHQADQAMYHSKKTGRNRVSVFDPASVGPVR